MGRCSDARVQDRRQILARLQRGQTGDRAGQHNPSVQVREAMPVPQLPQQCLPQGQGDLRLRDGTLQRAGENGSDLRLGMREPVSVIVSEKRMAWARRRDARDDSL